MAENILRLKVESQDYDSKLKRATQSLLQLEQSAKSMGQSLSGVTQEDVAFVQSLGRMETQAKTVRGSLNEMKGAFVELSAQYQRMTDEEKSSPFGQAMSQSLEQLKDRIGTAKSQLDDITQSMGGAKSEGESTGGVLDKLAGKFGLNSGELLKLGSSLGLASGALQVAKDAFFNNEEQLDEWGRVVESSKSLYNGFLNALNTGDISGYLSRMSSIVAAARQAYDALDELATFNAFNQINIQRTRTRLLEVQNDYREGKASKEDVQAAGAAYKKELATRQDKEARAYAAQIVKIAAERGVDATALYKALSGKYGDYEKLKKTPLTGVGYRTVGGSQWGGGQQVEYKFARTEEEKMGQALRALNDTELDHMQALGAAAQQTGFDMAKIDKQNLRILNGGGGGTTSRGGGGTTTRGGGGGTATRGGGRNNPALAPEGSIERQSQAVAALQKQYRLAADDDSRKKIKDQLEEAQKVLDEMEGKVAAPAAPAGSMKALQEEVQKLQQAQQLATTSDEWQRYQKDIDAAKQKMKELRGEVEDFSALTNKNLSSWMSAQQQRLGNEEIGSEGYQAISANIVDTKTLSNLLDTAIKNDITISPDTIDDLWHRIIGGENIPDSVWEDLVETINTTIEGLEIAPITLDVKTGDITQTAKQAKESWKEAAKAVQAVGGALTQLEDPGAKVAGLVGQAIANIALGFAQATAKSSNLGIFGWIAAIAGGMATMLSTISAIKSATAGSYAHGGIIGGNSYSGDNLTANVNSGELILNRAQQESIASQLGNGGGELHLSATLRGEDIALALNNLSRRKLRGEYITSR